MNSWPGGKRKALTQCEHEAWNGANYPGTLQLCVLCDEPTGCCEDDTLILADGTGPVCESCHG